MPPDSSPDPEPETLPWPQRLYDNIWLIAGTAILGVMAVIAVLAGSAFVIGAAGSLLFGTETRPAAMLPNYGALPTPCHCAAPRQ